MNRATASKVLVRTFERKANTELRCSGETSRSNTLNHAGRAPEPALSTRSGVRDRRKAFQSGTLPHAPLWNGSAPRPAFAAQALGQVMWEQRGDVAASIHAYPLTIMRPEYGSRLDVRL